MASKTVTHLYSNGNITQNVKHFKNDDEALLDQEGEAMLASLSTATEAFVKNGSMLTLIETFGQTIVSVYTFDNPDSVS